MTLKQLQYFKKAAEAKNITQAADELFIAQPALSKSIIDLEKELGVALFDRNGKKVALNHNGEILYKYAQKIQFTMTDLENELLEYNKNKSAAVRISFRVASRLLPDILKTYYQLHPDAALILYQVNQIAKTQPDYDLELDAVYDCNDKKLSRDNLIIGKTLNGQKTGSSVTDTLKNKKKLLEERILLAVPSNCDLAEKDKLYLEDLKSYSCCLLNEYSSLGKMLRIRFREHSFSPSIIFESDNPHVIRDFLRLDLSYSFVPELTWQCRQHHPNLVLREVEDFSFTRSIYLDSPEHGTNSPASRQFADFIADYFRKLDERTGL